MSLVIGRKFRKLDLKCTMHSTVFSPDPVKGPFTTIYYHAVEGWVTVVILVGTVTTFASKGRGRPKTDMVCKRDLKRSLQNNYHQCKFCTDCVSVCFIFFTRMP